MTGERADICAMLTGFPLDRVVVFDTETTGASPYSGDEVLSIAICDGMGNPLFSSYVRPARHKSWPDAERVNGISPAMVRDAPTLREITPQIREHLLGNRLVVGYNVNFDVSFLMQGKALESWIPATFDVMREYASVHGTRRSKFGDGYMYSKLSACAASYGYEFRAHDAMEDARATAHCFRALLCDEAYVKPEAKRRIDRLKSLSVSQTKATTVTVLELVEGGMTSSVRAELRLGAVTRGKTKGTPRYECFVDDRCVGVSSTSAVGQIRKIYALGEDAKLPAKVPCKALLSASGESAHCEVTITARGKVMEEVLAAAAETREREGMEYRRPEPQISKIPAERASREQPVTSTGDDFLARARSNAEIADTGAGTKGGSPGGCMGSVIAVLSVCVVFVLLATGGL